MKRLLIIAALIPCLSFGQDTSKLTVKNVYEDVKGGFTKLVNSLEGPAKHTYHVYVAQQRIEGLSYLGGTILCLIMAIIMIAPSVKKANWDDGNFAAVVTVVGCLLSIAFIAMAIGFFCSSYYSQTINPEYWAIQEIIKTLK